VIAAVEECFARFPGAKKVNAGKTAKKRAEKARLLQRDIK
jgi:hypothetical protein